VQATAIKKGFFSSLLNSTWFYILLILGPGLLVFLIKIGKGTLVGNQESQPTESSQ